MSTTIGTLPDGTRGFDANTTVGPDAAKLFFDAGYRFAVRYVKRVTAHSFDLSATETEAILAAGLGLMVVQHVAQPGWMPSGNLGNTYGSIAAGEATLAGIPQGVTLWCDLEGLSPAAKPSDVIAFCNSWYDAASSAGFEPGLYVGDSCGLSATQLYENLLFARYWSAYNLNRDNYPAVRGVQMRQLPYPSPANRVKGCVFEYDVDVIHTDALGGTPAVLLPE